MKFRYVLTILLASATIVTLPAAEQTPQVAPATLVLNNGSVVTADDARPTAQAIAVNGDTIVALGTNAEIGRYI